MGDLSQENVSALVRDAAVEDTDEIDRAAFRVSPSAPRRPYPASDAWTTVGSLWGVTVLCAVIGIIGVSIGIIARGAVGAAEEAAAPSPGG